MRLLHVCVNLTCQSSLQRSVMSHEASSNPYQYERETLTGRSSQSHINLPFVVHHPISMVEHVKKKQKTSCHFCR